MGIYAIVCPVCGAIHNWFSGDTDPRCDKCRTPPEQRTANPPDLVERLRANAQRLGDGWEDSVSAQAAAEIERLREALRWIAAHEYDAHRTSDPESRALITALFYHARAALQEEPK